MEKTIKKSKRREITIEKHTTGLFVITEWCERTGDSRRIWLDKSDIEAMARFVKDEKQKVKEKK